MREPANLPNLVPVTRANMIIYPASGEKYYTGWEIPDINRHIAVIQCVVRNDGNAPFVSDPAKNNHLIRLTWANYDPLTGVLGTVYEYWKNDFEPRGSCIPGLACSGSVNGTMGINTWDMYIEELNNLEFGIVALRIEYNASKQYEESNYRDNEVFVTFDWQQNPICGHMDDPDHGLACFNGTLTDTVLPNSVKNKLRRPR